MVIDREKKEFNKWVKSLNLSPKIENYFGVATFSNHEPLDIHSEEEMKTRFSHQWVISKENAEACEYGFLFHDKKPVALYKINRVKKSPDNKSRKVIDGTLVKKIDVDTVYDMFSPNFVMYFNIDDK